jgi:hypothetical protein
VSNPTGVLFDSPIAQPLSTVGQVQASAYLIFYLTGTTTPANVYADGLLTTPLSQTPGAPQPSCTANSAGQFNAIYLNPATIYRVQLFNSSGSKLFDIDPYVAGATVTQSQVGQALWPTTAAETAATVTPTNFNFPELTLERYGGGVSASATTNAAALTSALAVITQKNGGTIVCPAPGAPNGTYSFGANSFTLPENTIIQGSGAATEWLSTLTGVNAFLTTTGGRVQINDISLYGTSQGGYGVVLGASGTNSNRVIMKNVIMNYWNYALYIYGTIWSSFRNCEFGSALGGTYSAPVITNNYGVAFNPGTGANYSAQVSFYDCTVSNNAQAGVTSTNTALITANNINWYNINVQNNCVSNTHVDGTHNGAAYQFFMGLCDGFIIDGFYSEYLLGGSTSGGAGQSPCALSIYGLGYGSIRDLYIDICYNGITDAGGGSADQVWIGPGEIIGAANDIVDCNSNDIICWQVGGTPVVNTGAGSVTFVPGSGVATWPNNENTFNPVLTPAASGPITQTVKGLYSRFGNYITFDFEITWSALNSASGTVTVTGFPVAANSGSQGPGPGWALGYVNGITIASNSQLSLYLPAGSTTATLTVNGSSVTSLQASALAGAGTIRVSGGYHV